MYFISLNTNHLSCMSRSAEKEGHVKETILMKVLMAYLFCLPWLDFHPFLNKQNHNSSNQTWKINTNIINNDTKKGETRQRKEQGSSMMMCWLRKHEECLKGAGRVYRETCRTENAADREIGGKQTDRETRLLRKTTEEIRRPNT